MRLSEFIAEIRTSMKSYDAANLIDDISIQNWVIDELKRFGSNIMDLHPEVLFVRNGKATLPDNYWHLRLAARVKVTDFNLDEDGDSSLSRNLYDTIERGATWSTTGETGEVTEKTYTTTVSIDRKRVELHYNSPTLLKISRGVVRKRLDFECVNLSDRMANQSPFEIIINNRTVQTNFKEGFIYIQYYGFLSDEDGEIIIPETQHNRLKTYLEYFVKMKLIEELALNSDDPNKVNLLQYFEGKARNEFSLAMTEAKFESLNWKETRKLMRNQNRRKMMPFENMFPSI